MSADMDKDYIIAEIKRTAHENGGVAIGQQRFRSETSIKESDWRGVYWENWGQALQEAGFSPNEFSRAYEKEFLLEKLCTLIRELRRYPTMSRLKMQSRKDAAFPGETVFR